MRIHPIAASAALVFLLCLPNCSGTYGDICERQKDCEGGNDRDVDACIVELSAAEDVAAAYDCSEAFDKRLECLSERAFCKDGKFEDDPCKPERDALSSCQRAASARK